MATISKEARQYPDLTSGYNQRWSGTPESVVLVESVEQVAPLVQEAVRDGKRMTVNGAGHCFEDFVYNSDVDVVINMKHLDAVYYDPAMNAVAVEAGSNLLNVYEKLYERWGVTLPGGLCYSVGVGGHVSGGGWGALARRHGLIVDHLYAVEVVVVGEGGEVRRVVATREEDDPNRDLWWAHTGGGGGNFGVITRYWFRSPGATGREPGEILPRPPRHVLLSAAALSWDEITEAGFTRLVNNYADWHVRNSRPGSRAAGLFGLAVLNHRSNGQIGLITQVEADLPGADDLLAEYLDAITDGVGAPLQPMTASMGEYNAMPGCYEAQRLPWLQATRFLGTNNVDLNNPTLRADYKSGYMRGNFPDKHVATMYQSLTSTDIDNSTATMHLQGFGAQVNAVPESATAFAHRSSFFKLYWQVLWDDPADDDEHLTWLRRFYADLYRDTGGVPVPNELTDGCYVNYPDVDLNSAEHNQSQVPWYRLYYKENYERLQQVKKRFDPRDVFRHAQSVRLPD
ncbi:MAG: FAD-binding oxidoreductase [Saccharopolyspora sp.]|uniref:FAD-dependent oxidoreductase n=1 Tax=Saccharopolyspora sp. TaxID=33915 RepID=UPI00260057B7|nr:FAD-binding protein [Saccharopolyspora sp.]MBQ6642035.1 FAD-binding oxidoreductase [Saccharopolyspora sp.]